jgi:hypothetical protein
VKKDKPMDEVFNDLVAVLKRHSVSPKDAATVLLFLFDSVCKGSGVNTVAALRGAAGDLEKKKEVN